MLSCEVVTDLMPAYEAGEASAETRRLVEEHLAACAICRGAFGRGSRVEGALNRAGAVREERSLNGQRFVSRTRRLFFFIGAGVLLLLGVYAAMVMRVFLGAGARGWEGQIGLTPWVPVGPFPAAGFVLLAALGAGLLYIVLVLSRTQGSRALGGGDVARAVAAGALLTVLALATLYLWVAGPVVLGLLAAVPLLGALGVTLWHLATLPYFTIVTIVSLGVALVLLLNFVLVGRMVGLF
jgi:predicted anti-sigma-YlaC factor YlaD